MYKRPNKLLFMGNVIRYAKQVVLVLLLCISKSNGKTTVHLDVDIKKFESKHNIQLNCTTSEIPIPIAAFLLNDASLATIALSKTTCRIGQKECNKEECECGPNFFFYNVTTYLKQPQNTFTCELRFNKRKKDKNVHFSVMASVLHNESGIFILGENKDEKGQVFSKSENGTADSEEREDDGSASKTIAIVVSVLVILSTVLLITTIYMYCTRKKRTGQKKASTDIVDNINDDTPIGNYRVNGSPCQHRGLSTSNLTSTNEDAKESEDKTQDLTETAVVTFEKEDKKCEDKKQDLTETAVVTFEKEDKKCEDTRKESPDSELISTQNDDVKSEDETHPLLNCNDDSENSKEIDGVVQKQEYAEEIREIGVKLDSTVNGQLLESDSEQNDCTSDEDDTNLKFDFPSENNNIVENIDGGDKYVPPYSVKGMKFL